MPRSVLKVRFVEILSESPHGEELHGAVVEVDDTTGRAAAIRRIALT